MLRAYYRLTKPGIIYGNLLTAAAGFLLAARGHIRFWLLLATLLGTGLVIASACVFNNYIDRDIDRRMARTRRRALVTGQVTARNALIYATAMLILGVAILIAGTNLLVLAVGLSAFIIYVLFYGLAKRRSVHGTLVGSLSGAAPPLAGYLAVTDHLDGGAALVFLVLVFWQMPHFYAIAIRRLKDYRAAGLPVLPVRQGIRATKLQIVAYIIAFAAANSLLSVFGYTGYVYLAVMLAVSLTWLYYGWQGFSTKDDQQWARQLFLISLLVILSLSVMLSVGPLLP